MTNRVLLSKMGMYYLAGTIYMRSSGKLLTDERRYMII